MMILKLREEIDVPVEIDGILPSTLSGKSLDEIKAMKIHHGNRKISLDEIFDIAIEDGDEDTLICEGDFSKVKWLGYEMDGGRIVVRGNAGVHCGAKMKDGEIIIEGSADDYLGAEMTGGKIEVKGDAGNYVGSAYHGNARGMRGGEIIIHGSAGNFAGEKMSDGSITIKGDAGDFVGYRMSGGVITIEGNAGIAGASMMGGKIIVEGNCIIPPTFEKTEEGLKGDFIEGGKGVLITGP